MKTIGFISTIVRQVMIIGLILLLQPQDIRSQFANGADIGWLSEMESEGYVFVNDSGVQKNCLEILEEHGINALRFRVWVNPGTEWCSKKGVAYMAHRADSMGFDVMIDFHYSDTWADPGKQTKPAAWADDTLEQLLTDIYDHTYDMLDTLKYLGVTPKWVQVGNETNNGMLWPDGRASDHMDHFAAMINSGYDAVKAIDSTIQVIVHLSNGHDNGLYRWMFDGLTNNNAHWDIIGMSVYPYWAELPWETVDTKSLANMQDMISRYQKPVMVCETGYLYNQATEANHFLLDLIGKTKSVDGLGVFYWEPECYNWQNYRLGAWNPVTKKPTTAMDTFLGIEDTTSTTPVAGYHSDGKMNLFPNPVEKDQPIIIEVSDPGESTHIRIVDISGHQLLSFTSVNKKNIEIDALKFPSGLYFVQLESLNQKIIRLLRVE
jgi:arabinogalactan endo-1,4-beta-galactosidase